MASPDRTHMQKHVKNKNKTTTTTTKTTLFILSQLRHIINIDTRKLFYNAHIKPHIDYESVVWDGFGEVELKTEEKTKQKPPLNSLHRRAGKLILPDHSLSTEQNMRTLGILNLPQQLAYNKGTFMHKIINNNSPNYLAQLFISHQSHYTNSKNKLYVLRPRLDLFKTGISFAGASLWNSLPQNIKSGISVHSNVICINTCLRITFRQIWTDLFELHVCLKIGVLYRVVYMYAHERNLTLMFLHICRNYESALINCLIILIIFACGIVFICVCSIARTGC